MMHVYHCSKCGRTCFLAHKKTKCPECSGTLRVLPVAFKEFTLMSEEEREKYILNTGDTLRHPLG